MRFNNITDGLSNTLMIGEDVPKYNQHSAWFYSNGDYCSCHMPLNYIPGKWGISATSADWPKVMGFRSQHANLVQFAAADASVHAIRDNINHDLHRALCTRELGEQATIP